MKGNNLSRLELLQWLNEFTECDYPKVEMCCDGIGYCQVIDAIHPNAIPLSKLNFNAKLPDEFTYNLRILDEVFKKMQIQRIVQIEKLAKGKFQDNINFLQWLYNYAAKIGPFALKTYHGYERRLGALSKQKYNKSQAMNAHLIPNNAFLNFKPKKIGEYQNNNNNNSGEMQYQYNQYPQQQSQQQQNAPTQFSQIKSQQVVNQNQEQDYNVNVEEQPENQIISSKINFIGSVDTKMNKRIQYLEDYQKELEIDLKNKMEYNWKILYALDDMIYQRSTLYQILKDIETLSGKFKDSPTKQQIMNILSQTPNDFQQVKQDKVE